MSKRIVLSVYAKFECSSECDLDHYPVNQWSCSVMSDSYPMDCSLPGSSIHGIFQARVLEWIAISFSRGSSQPRDRAQVSHTVDRRFTIWGSMNQGKLEMVKQEMGRMNVDILGISEVKWTGMGEFNSDDHYIYYCGEETLRKNGVAIIVKKRVWNAVLGCNLKNDRMITVHFQGKPFNITVIQVYAPTSNAEEADVERFYEDLRDLQDI